MTSRDKGLIFEAENPTVESFLGRWLNNSVKASVKQRTYESYEYVVRRHLLPALGSKKLRNLTPAQVQDSTSRSWIRASVAGRYSSYTRPCTKPSSRP